MLQEITNGVRWTNPNTGYQPPTPQRPAPFTPPTVRAGTPKLEGGTAVEQAQTAIEHAKTAWEKHVAATNEQKEHYSPEGYRAQLAAFADTEAAKAVDRALTQVETRADNAAKDLAQIRAALSPNGDTAAELRATRYWNRTKPLLDNAKNPFTTAKELISAASREELGVLLQELPAYLQARGIPAEWIDHHVATVVPEYGDSVRRHQRAQKALAIARHNAAVLRRTFTTGDPTAAVILVDGRKFDPDTD